ncbi:MAG: PAS domain-containing protein [Rhodospirillales bacterium]|nr:PAS domain-containing protein [Rhodospirillales bacterium]
MRTKAQGPFDGREKSELARLRPHLRRAFGLDRRLRAARAAAARMESVLDALPEAVLATDAAGRIRHANRAAEALLGAGDVLRLARGHLTAALPSEAALLEAALHRAVATRAATAPGPAASLVLHARDGARLGVSVVPLGRRASLPGLPEENLALVSARPLDPPRADPAPLRAASPCRRCGRICARYSRRLASAGRRSSCG